MKTKLFFCCLIELSFHRFKHHIKNVFSIEIKFYQLQNCHTDIYYSRDHLFSFNTSGVPTKSQISTSKSRTSEMHLHKADGNVKNCAPQLVESLPGAVTCNSFPRLFVLIAPPCHAVSAPSNELPKRYFVPLLFLFYSPKSSPTLAVVLGVCRTFFCKV